MTPSWRNKWWNYANTNHENNCSKRQIKSVKPQKLFERFSTKNFSHIKSWRHFPSLPKTFVSTNTSEWMMRNQQEEVTVLYSNNFLVENFSPSICWDVFLCVTPELFPLPKKWVIHIHITCRQWIWKETLRERKWKYFNRWLPWKRFTSTKHKKYAKNLFRNLSR